MPEVQTISIIGTIPVSGRILANLTIDVGSYGLASVTQPAGPNSPYTVTLSNPIGLANRVEIPSLYGIIGSPAVGIRVIRSASTSSTVVVEVLDSAGASIDATFGFGLTIARTSIA